MLTLSFTLSEEWNDKTRRVDLINVNEMALRYDLFLGDIVMISDSIDFSTKWGWVPVLDFAASLSVTANKLSMKDDERVEFEFTESNELIKFYCKEKNIIISTTYADGEAKLPLMEFLREVTIFANRVTVELTRLYPLLANNESFKHLSQIMLAVPNE